MTANLLRLSLLLIASSPVALFNFGNAQGLWDEGELYCAHSDPNIPFGSASQDFSKSQAVSIPTSGSFRALIIFIRFKDDSEAWGSGSCSIRQQEWPLTATLPDVADRLLSDQTSGPFADSSLTSFYYEQSNGQFVLYGAHYSEVVVTAENESEYTSLSNSGRGKLTDEVLGFLDSEGFDFSTFDANSDGFIDHIFFVVRRNSSSFAPGWAGIADLGNISTTSYDGVSLSISYSGSYSMYGGAGIIIPQVDLTRVMAHEFGHPLWNWQTDTFGGHLEPILVTDNDVPFEPSPVSEATATGGYALMIGRGDLHADVGGAITMSAYERSLLTNWIDCPTLSNSQTVALGDLYETGACARIDLTNDASNRYLMVSNRQRLAYFDQHRQPNAMLAGQCTAFDHGLMTTGISAELILDPGTSERRRDIMPADNDLANTLDTLTFYGDLYSPSTGTQITPWTRPNSNGFTFYPTSYNPSWKAIDNIRNGTGSVGELKFDFVQDFRTDLVVRENSWFGLETDEESFSGDITIQSGDTLTIEDDVDIYLKTAKKIIVNGVLVINNGSIGGDPKWSGITVNTGGKLVLNAGATLDMTDYGDIYVYGEIEINGTSADPVTVQGTNWDWIYVSGPGADGSSIDHAIIDGSRKGIYVVNADDISISNTDVTDSQQQGLWVESLTGSTAQTSTFSGGDANGIHVKNGGLYIDEVEVKDNGNYGIRLENSSTVSSGGDQGDNIITGNADHGLYLTASSASLGEYVGTPIEAILGGGNVIHSNSGKDVYALSSSTIVAEENWWGESPPNTSDFHISANSTFDYDPWMTSAPSGAQFALDGEVVQEVVLIERQLTEGELSSIGQKTGEFVRALQSVRETQSRLHAIEETAIVVSSEGEHHELALLFLLNDLLHSGQISEAIQTGEDALLSLNYSDLVKAEIASILFRGYLLQQADNLNAQRMYALANTLSPETVDAEAMEILLEDYGDGSAVPETADASKTEESDSLFSIFPNPFNPSTTFNLSIKESSYVLLTIHDIVGREVARIVDRELPEGGHTFRWTPQSLSSGVYLYRLNNGSRVEAGKIVLLK